MMGQLDSSFTSIEGISLPGNAFVVIINTEWNNSITDKLTASCVQVLELASIPYQIITVPGAVEIVSVIAAHQLQSNQKTDAYIAFGCVIQGGTPHFEYVCNMVSQGISQLNASQAVPTIFGVLTVNDMQQAIDRTGGAEGDKGKEAAMAAIKMINIRRQFLAD